ncbi:carboxylate--amine ligase [Dermabacter sp. Marseille-Q3180]|uniref:carboxylate--amine ligase n=1 Tax=Dermabacter sp. Marseille-Q3180 TaxID=2758090 RepID=UPI002025A36F|nr:carboxylate--amine ligase [Dermabacter sp. Marseille-Q3180]
MNSGYKSSLEIFLVGTGLGIYTLSTAFHALTGVRTTTITRTPIAAQKHSASGAVIELGPTASDADIVAELLARARSREAEALTAGRTPAKHLLLCNEDALVEMFAKHRGSLEKYFVLPIPSDQALEAIVDKAEFAKLCATNKVPAPRTEIVDFSCDPFPSPTKLEFPVVAKVAKASALLGLSIPEKKKVYFVRSQAELDQVWTNHRDAAFTGRFVVQELIPGDDTAMWSLTLYRDKNGSVTLRASARVLLEEHTPEALGRPAAMLTQFDPDVLAQATRLLDAVDYRGFANVDLKRDPKTGTLLFLEINPRIGRNNFYVTGAGANVAQFPLADALHDTSLECVDVKESILYSLVPMALLSRYVKDSALWTKVKRAARKGVKNPWVYGPDNPRAKLYSLAVAANHIRKFQTHYPRPTQTGF